MMAGPAKIARNNQPVDLVALAQNVGAGLAATPGQIVVADAAAKVTVAQLQAAFDALEAPATPAPSPVPMLLPQTWIASVQAIDTSQVTDPAAQSALNVLKAAILAAVTGK